MQKVQFTFTDDEEKTRKFLEALPGVEKVVYFSRKLFGRFALGDRCIRYVKSFSDSSLCIS